MPEGDRVLVRAPNHLGELVLALPALERAAELWPGRPLVQLPGRLAPVLEMSTASLEVLPLAGRHRFPGAVRSVRARSPDVGILLTPSFSSALLLRLCGVPHRRGTDTDARGWLLTDRVDREPLLAGHRVREYLALVEGAAGDAGPARSAAGPDEEREPPRPRLRPLEEARRSWRAAARTVGIKPDAGGGTVGLVPGGRASSRRWPAERWRELAGRLLERGLRVRVFGGPDEEPLTRAVAGDRSGAVALGGRTDLAALAGGLAACDAVATNDTGPMHLADALDRPLAAVWGAGDPDQTRPLSPAARLLGTLDLPCHPCLEEACPRSGEGYRSPTAERECLRLVPVDRVERTVIELLEGGGRHGRADPPARAGGERRSRSGDDAFAGGTEETG